METTINPNDFSNLLRCLSLLKNSWGYCNDVEIRGGFLRQRTADRACIFEMDLTSLVSDCDIVMSDLKSKLPLLKELSKQEVKIISNDSGISFCGERSTFQFASPRIDFLDNKFIPDQEMSKIFILKEEGLVLEYHIGSETSKLMKVITSQFKIASFQVSFEGNVGAIIATTTSKDQYSRIENGIPLKVPLRCFSSLVVTPFIIDHDGDILLKMYNVQETVCVNKFETLVGKTTVTVYGRSQLIEEEESDNSATNYKESSQGMDPSN